MNFQLITDGSCDLDPVLAKNMNIDVVPFYVSFDGETYKREIAELGIREFYEQMVANSSVFPKTSMPSTDDYINAFMPYVKQNIPVLCICITTLFSGSYNSAMSAKTMIEEDYPDAVIEVIDSTVDTVLQGIFVLEIARMRDAGYSLEQTVARLEEIKTTGRIFFTVGSLDYLLHGGRAGKVGKAAGSVASALNIRPLIILKEGEIHFGGISRGRKKSLVKTVELITKHFEETGESVDDYVIVVGFGYDREEAEEFRNMVMEATGKTSMDIFQIGATIAVHTGPYPLGVGLIKKAF